MGWAPGSRRLFSAESAGVGQAWPSAGDSARPVTSSLPPRRGRRRATGGGMEELGGQGARGGLTPAGGGGAGADTLGEEGRGADARGGRGAQGPTPGRWGSRREQGMRRGVGADWWGVGAQGRQGAGS